MLQFACSSQKVVEMYDKVAQMQNCHVENVWNFDFTKAKVKFIKKISGLMQSTRMLVSVDALHLNDADLEQLYFSYKEWNHKSQYFNWNQSALCISCSHILTAVFHKAFVHFPILYSLYSKKGGLSIFFFYGIQMGII